MNTYYATFNRFEFELPLDAVYDCSHGGDVTADVTDWVKRIDLSHISNEALAEELEEYGAWSTEELSNRADNEMRILWLGACNISEELLDSMEA